MDDDTRVQTERNAGRRRVGSRRKRCQLKLVVKRGRRGAGLVGLLRSGTVGKRQPRRQDGPKDELHRGTDLYWTVLYHCYAGKVFILPVK